MLVHFRRLKPARAAAFTLAWLANADCSHGALEVTVSPAGPIRTLVEARDAIRKKRAAGENGPATIAVEAGVHEATATLHLEPQDSDLTIRAAVAGNRPVFTGSRPIGAVAVHRGRIVKADVRPLLGKDGTVRQVFAKSGRLTLARYPNADTADPLYGGWAFVDEIPPGAAENHHWKTELYVRPGDVRRWEHPEDVQLNIFAQYGWWNFIEPVKALDSATRKLTLAKPCSYDLHPHNRYILQNAIEELDAPGEWFWDRRTGFLHVWPPDGSDATDLRLATLGTFIKIGSGTHDVLIRDLAFTACNDSAIVLEKTERCTVAGCAIDTVGDFHGSGIVISGGTRNAAVSNDISQTGSNGISLSGGDRITLTAADNRAENNHIHHMGVFNKNACGVSATGCGLTVAHNDIHHGPRMGVQISGNRIAVEYNHLHDLVLETQDGGAIYTGGRDWLGGRGNLWRYNRIHDIVGVGQEKGGLVHPWFTFGIYPDDNTGGVDIVGNIVYRCAHTPIHMHNSRDCIVENNVFAFGGKFQFDLHGWTSDMPYWKDHGPSMIKGYDSVADQPAWRAMRGMNLHPKDAFRDDGTMMSGNVVRRNIMLGDTPGVKYGDLRHCTPKWNTIDENIVWNGGHPIATGLTAIGADIGDDLLKGDGRFDNAPAGQTPKGWGFNHRPTKDVNGVVADGALKVNCGTSADPKNNHTVFHGPDLPFKPGAAYRVKFRARSSGSENPISVALAVYKAGSGYWQTSGTRLTVGPEWKAFEVVGKLPAGKDPAWKPWMEAFWLRFDLHGETGDVTLDDVIVTEAEPLDEWTAWQQAGWDRHSIVADPLFVDPAKGDFRLLPGSPALKLGFQPIPVEKIGLQKDAYRTRL